MYLAHGDAFFFSGEKAKSHLDSSQAPTSARVACARYPQVLGSKVLGEFPSFLAMWLGAGS